MIKATIENQTYQIKTTWSDVTIKDMAKAQDYISKMPQWLSNYIYSEEEEKQPVSDQKLLTFYIDWVLLFSDIHREYLESEIKVDSSNELSLTELFGLVVKFLGEPSEDQIGKSESILLGDKKYVLIKSVKSAGGVEKLLGGATYKHFSESQALSQLFQKKQYRKWEYLSKITAILFRLDENEMYDEDVISMRAKAFEDLPVSEVYKGYFFLLSHINSLQTSIASSLTEKKEKAQAHTRKQSLKTHIGNLKPLSWLRKVFLTNKD